AADGQSARPAAARQSATAATAWAAARTAAVTCREGHTTLWPGVRCPRPQRAASNNRERWHMSKFIPAAALAVLLAGSNYLSAQVGGPDVPGARRAAAAAAAADAAAADAAAAEAAAAKARLAAPSVEERVEGRELRRELRRAGEDLDAAARAAKRMA